MPVRPLRWPIRAAMTSPCTSQQALALAGFPTWEYVRCFPGICAARSGPMTSPAHRACAVSRAGQHARIIPETRSARSANITPGMQHVMPRTRPHVGTPVCRIHPTLAYILAVHAAGSYPTWNISGPDHEDAPVQAVREVRHGPRTSRRANPARSPNQLYTAQKARHTRLPSESVCPFPRTP